MKKINIRLRWMLIPFACMCVAVADKTYLNEDFILNNGNPLNLNWTLTTIASSGHVITVGNTQTSGQGANVHLSKTSTNGTIVWQVEHNGVDGLNDYGVSVSEDTDGAFWVAAATESQSTGSMDILLLRYSAGGQLLADYTYAGTAGGDDFPTSITTDGTDAIITGYTQTASNGKDLILIRVDDAGNALFEETYDYNGLDDAGAKVSISGMGVTGIIKVVGGSASQVGVYDMVALKYSPAGTLLNTQRSSYNAGFTQVTSFGQDTLGNTVVAGYYVDQQSNTQMSLVSLDDTLGINWYLNYDPSAGEDVITDVAVSPDGNIFTTGYSEGSPGYVNIHTARYSSTGTQVWEKTFLVSDGGAQGRKISISAQGPLDIAGTIWHGTDTNLLLMRYRQNGQQVFVQEHDASASEIATAVNSDYGGNIYISGTTTQSGGGYVTVKYNLFERTLTEVNDTIDSIDYVDNEMLIQFYPEFMDSNAVDNKGKTHGLLSTFVKQAAIDSLNACFDNEYEFARMHAVKVFRGLSTQDSFSITRSGDTLEMPPFFATLLIFTPAEMNEMAAATHLDSTAVGVLEYAELNQISYPSDLPNDTRFVAGDQEGLESSNSPENDINMDQAWDIQHGKDNVKVGIVDSGINWDHIDFNKTGSFTGIPGDAKISGGYDFLNSVDPFSTMGNDVYGHGTKMAGVLGAIRNNDQGVAGVAGGDLANDNSGVSLVDLKIADDRRYSTDLAITAIIEGAKDQPSNPTNPGYAVHVLNLSFGSQAYSKGLETAIRFAYNNECAIAAAAGNRGNMSVEYPASLAHRMTISVGASGLNGARAQVSNYGSLDVIAPGVPELVHTVDIVGTGYTEVEGTSPAAAHVAGVAGLLHSQVKSNYNPNQLAPEDVEQLIIRHTSDVQDPGYDSETGHGRLNAGEVMEHMVWPYYWVEHYQATTTNYTSTMIFQDVKVTLERGHDGIKRGDYKCDIFMVQCTLSHDIDNADMLGAWALNGATVSTPYRWAGTSLKPEANVQLIYADDNTAVLRGHIYHVKNKWLLGGSVDEWIPFEDGDPGKFAYSMHLYDPEASGTEDERASNINGIAVYPNPTSTNQRIEVAEPGEVRIELFDVHGRKLASVFEGASKGNLEVEHDLSSLEVGIYFYRISIDGNEHTLRVVKQ